MSWADRYIAMLQSGQTVRFRPRGGSMRGRIESGQLCTVKPIDSPVERDEVVLCRVRGAQYLHVVKAVKGDRYLIGNNRGGTNGWIGQEQIYGRLVLVED